MKLIKSSFEVLKQGPGLEGMYEAIETAGRTCYKSTRPEGKTAKDFVDRMIASNHTAMLEHGTVYLDVMSEDIVSRKKRYCNNPYSRVYKNTLEETWAYPHLYVTTNYRVLLENGWLDDLKYLCEPTKYHERRISVRFVCDRGVSHEFVRHRVFSFAQESTRYCNYSKDKFGNELTFIVPSWLDELELQRYGAYHTQIRSNHPEEVFVASANIAERAYKNLINNGWTPQQARQVLPNAIKTELVMTGFVSDWHHFFDLRALGTTGAPHPDAKALAEPLMHQLQQEHLI